MPPIPKPPITTPAIEALVTPSVVQHRRHVREHAEHENRFHKHGAEAVFRQRIAQHRAIVRQQRRKIEAAGGFAYAAETRDRESERDQIDAAGYEKHAAPAEQVADHAGARGAQEIAAHGGKQQLADRDLALRDRNAVAGECERDREYAAGDRRRARARP